MLGELQAALARDGSELRLTEVRAPVARLLARAGLEIAVDHPSRVIPPPTAHP
jgi:hypothetical protein